MQPDLAVVAMPVASLVPYAANARTHSDAQVAQIAASIAEFGFVNPVLVDAAGVLVAGHGRVLAAKRLGMASVPAIRLAHLTEAQARALRLADNQIALNSGWDEALLVTELALIRDDGFDLALLGFDQAALDALLADAGLGGDGEAGQAGEDAPAPEPPPEPITRPGDQFRHRNSPLHGNARRHRHAIGGGLGARMARDRDMALLDQPGANAPRAETLGEQ